MSIAPWYTGQTSPALQITLKTDTGSDNISGLVAGNFALVIRNTSNNSDANGTGTFTIISAVPAVITYAFSSGDVATPGSYSLIIKATYPSGMKVYDPIAFTITGI